MSLRVRIAETPEDFKSIARLNYETFVEEIPQHGGNRDRLLEDKFHAENTYFLCFKEESDLVGMVACRDRRPFSLDAKISDLDALLPPSQRPCEVRLLTIRPDRRHSRVFGLLMEAVFAHCLRRGYDLGLISGRVLHIPLYEKLGFRAFGPRVGTAEAPYQPMYIDHRTVNRALGHFAGSAASAAAGTGP